MADVIKIGIGAAFSSGFSSVFSSAEKTGDSLGNSVNSLKNKIGDVGAHKRLQSETLALGEALDEAKKKTASLKDEVARSEKPTKAQTKAVKDAEKEELRLASALEKKDNSLKSSSAALRQNGIDVSRLTEEEKRLGAELERNEKRMKGRDKFKRAFGFGDKKDQTIGEAFGNAKNSIGSAARDFAVVGAAVGGGMFMLAKGAADYGDEVSETATKIGISTKALQEFRAIGAGVGVETEAMDSALSKFSINLGKAAQKKGGSEEFRKMGLNLNQLLKMGPEKAMGKVTEAISRMPSHTKRAAAAVELFGKSGVGMLNVISNGEKPINGFYKSLGGGANALAKAREEVAKTGLVMNEVDLDKAGQWDDEMNRLSRTMLGVRNTIGIALVPAFTDMFSKLSDWVQGHGTEIRTFADNLGTKFGEIAPKLIDVAHGLGRVAETTFKVTDAAAGLVGGWDNLIVVMAVGRLVPVIMSLGTLVSTIWGGVTAAWAWAGGWAGVTAAAGTAATAIWAALAPMLPFIALGLAIGALGLYIYKNWDELKAFYKDFFERIVEWCQPAIDWLGKIADIAGNAISTVKELFSFGDKTPTFAKMGATLGAPNMGIQGNGSTGGALAGQAIADAMAPKSYAKVSVPPSRPGSLTKTEHHNYQIKVDGSGDPSSTAHAVRQELDRRERDRAASKRSSYSDKEAY